MVGPTERDLSLTLRRIYHNLRRSGLEYSHPECVACGAKADYYDEVYGYTCKSCDSNRENARHRRRRELQPDDFIDDSQ